MAKQCVMKTSGPASAVEGQKMALIGSILAQTAVTSKEAVPVTPHQVLNLPNGTTMDCYVRGVNAAAAQAQPIVYTGTIEGPMTYTQSRTHFEVITQLKPRYTVHTTTTAAVPQVEAPVAATESIQAVEVTSVPQQQQQQITMNLPAVQMVVPQTSVVPHVGQTVAAPQYGYQQMIGTAQPQQFVNEPVVAQTFMTQAFLRPTATPTTTFAAAAPIQTAYTAAPIQTAYTAAPIQTAYTTAPAAATFALPTFQSVGANAMPLELLCQNYFEQMKSTNASFNPIAFTRELLSMNDEQLQQWLGQRGFFDNPTQYVMGPEAVRSAILKFVERGGVPEFQVLYTPEVVENLLDFYAGADGETETTEEATAAAPAAAAETPAAAGESNELIKLLSTLSSSM